MGGAHRAALLEAEMRELRMLCRGEASSVLVPLPADPRALRAVRTTPCCWRLKMHVVLVL